jgi:DNA mismatch repair protein MutH
MREPAPCSELELLARVRALAGCTLGEVAGALGVALPANPRRAKGWIGGLLEHALGADAGSRSEPDFTGLGVELKTIPVDADGVPRESTYVCVATGIEPGATWQGSRVRRKLQRVLWVPVESATAGVAAARRIGWGFLWCPSAVDEGILQRDWEELSELLILGRRAEISGRLGEYLQLRPKGADRDASIATVDADGVPGSALPLGFYLRAGYTRRIVTESACQASSER